MNHFILQEAFNCYEYYTDGYLPNQGTILDQSTFFIESAKMVKRAVKKKEQESLE